MRTILVTGAAGFIGSNFVRMLIQRGENVKLVALDKLTYAGNLANSQITNLTASEASIKDANVAQDASNLAQEQTLQQSSIAALAQANSIPQAVLKLLQ